MNKELLTNFIGGLIVASSFFLPEPYSQHLFYTGAFALSGSLTNQLAIYMLFNKIPFLYGSGIIELQFEKLKSSIKSLIMTEFFTKDRIEEFLKSEEKKIEISPLVEKFDFSPAFESLKSAVMESKFASMLNLVGGESALENLKEPFVSKLKHSLVKITSSDVFKEELNNFLQSSTFSDDLLQKIDSIVQKRLDELDPQMVKALLENLIKEYLGWLVIWGGVFGGLLGFIASFVSAY